MITKHVYDLSIDVVNGLELKQERAVELIDAATPIRKETGNLKLIAAFKLIAALGTTDLSPSIIAQGVDAPASFKKFEEKIQEFLAHIMNEKFHIKDYVQKIS